MIIDTYHAKNFNEAISKIYLMLEPESKVEQITRDGYFLNVTYSGKKIPKYQDQKLFNSIYSTFNYILQLRYLPKKTEDDGLNK